MSLQQITDKLRGRVGESAGLNRSVKFDFGSDGVVRIDDTVKPAVVDNQDAPADCTVRVTMADFVEIASGRQNPQAAFMTGKLKVDGDLSVALQLGKLLG